MKPFEESRHETICYYQHEPKEPEVQKNGIDKSRSNLFALFQQCPLGSYTCCCPFAKAAAVFTKKDIANYISDTDIYQLNLFSRYHAMCFQRRKMGL